MTAADRAKRKIMTLRPNGLTADDYGILATLAKDQGTKIYATVSLEPDVAEAGRESLARKRELEKMGLIIVTEVHPSDSDRERYHLEITSDGLAALAARANAPI